MLLFYRFCPTKRACQMTHASKACRMSATKKDINVTLIAVQLTCVTARSQLKAEVKLMAKVGKNCLEIGKMQCNVCLSYVAHVA